MLLLLLLLLNLVHVQCIGIILCIISHLWHELTTSLLVAIVIGSWHNRLDLIQSCVPTQYVDNGNYINIFIAVCENLS
jgi:hypothetical protein